MRAALPFLLDLLGLALILVFLGTQVILPVGRGTKLFPWFRKRRQELATKLTELNEEKDVLDLEEQVHHVEEEVENKRKRFRPETNQKQG